MNENTLRWKARIGSLKALGLLVAIFAILFLLILGSTLSTALNNSSTPQPAQLSQLVKNEIGTDRYVTVSGVAVYDVGYHETKDGKTITEYYFLIEEESNSTIVVRSPALISEAQRSQPEPVTISGLTRSAPSDLRKMIESDVPDIRKAGLETTATLYLAQGQTPPSAAVTIALMLLLGLVVILCLIPLFFPGIVFAPSPIELTGTPASGNPGVKATGRFQRLAKVEPELVLGKGTQKFKEAVANIVPLDGRRLMIYIRHVMTYRYSFIPFFRQTSHWGVFIESSNVTGVESGKLLGWRDRLAVRVHYTDEKDKQQELIVSFNHTGAQSEFVNQLRQMGFAIGAGALS